MRRRRTQQPIGQVCPADPAHGPLLEIDGRLWCPHQSHDAAKTRRPEERAAAFVADHPMHDVAVVTETFRRADATLAAEPTEAGPLTLWR